MKRSEWMKGLLYAEQIGLEAAIDSLYKNEFDSDFENGVYDYIKYVKENNL